MSERHRHRYEVNNAYRDQIAESGLRFSGTSPDGHLVEFVEYAPDVHPFIVGTQAHPGAQEPAHPAAPAVRRVHRRVAGLQERRTAAGGMPEIPDQRDQRCRAHPRRRARAWVTRTATPAITTSPSPPPRRSTSATIFALRADEVRMPGGTHGPARDRRTLRRGGRRRASTTTADIVLVYQYRHAFGRRLWELPAGPARHGRRAAARVGGARNSRRRRDWRPTTWRTLVDLDTAPGFSDESVRVFLATGLSDVGRPEGERRRSRPHRRACRARRGGRQGVLGGDRELDLRRRHPGRARDDRHRCAARRRRTVDRQAHGVRAAEGTSRDAAVLVGRRHPGRRRSRVTSTTWRSNVAQPRTR